MNRTEENIDKVLVGLRDAPVPLNMERRILNVLEASPRAASGETASPIRVGRNPFSWSLGWASLIGCAALAVATCVFVIHTHRHAATTPEASFTQTPIAAPEPQPPLAAAATTPPASTSHTLTSPRVSRNETPQRIEVAQSEDSEDTTQISHPAPPIPLTDQERLLLRFAHHGRSNDLAEISNDRKAAREEQENAEFQAFFEPPPTIMNGESE
jgi:hypothetical protein